MLDVVIQKQSRDSSSHLYGKVRFGVDCLDIYVLLLRLRLSRWWLGRGRYLFRRSGRG